MPTHVYTPTHTYTHIHTPTQTYTHLHTYTCKYIHTSTHLHTPIRTYILLHTHTYTPNGVHQGSDLDPLLFNIYIQPLFSILTNTHILHITHMRSLNCHKTEILHIITSSNYFTLHSFNILIPNSDNIFFKIPKEILVS